MELLQQESSRFGAPTSTRNLSSSSSAFVSACQSPFFSPRSPREDSQLSESNKSDYIHTSSSVSQSQPVIIRNAYAHRPPVPISYSLQNHNTHSNDIPSSSHGPSSIRASQLKHNQRSALCKESSVSNSGSNGTLAHRYPLSNRTFLTSRANNAGQNNNKISFARTSASLSSSARLRSCDVYIGTHGQKPSLLRFTKWLRVELELQGIACFAADRARYTDSRSHDIADKVISSATFGVVIITKKSFANPYSIEELRIFLGRKNLVPLFFDLGPGDCLARDIIEKRGELWEKQGGDLWMLYDGDKNEWKEAMDGLSRVTDEWRLEAQTGNWRSCILRAVSLLGSRLGRRSVAERERVRKVRIQGQEYPFPRNPGFVGRKKELLELEDILFGKEDSVDGGDDGILDIKIRPRRKDRVIVRRRSNGNRSKKQAGEQGEGKMENRRLSESDRLKDIEGGEEQKERRKSEADKWELKRKGKNAIPVNMTGSTKGKELAIWKETENEIEIHRSRATQRTSDRRQRARVLHRARFAEKYRLVLWVGGETR
ncbi:hypothetical protein SUGI_0861080 [Cryptomeria japonica]|nr:hypothetical protein SUGI_0861080 [Cryptomeria japonica]